MKLISLVSHCCNEEKNIPELYDRITKVMQSLNGYDYEIIFIDNASTDKTVGMLRELAATDTRVKVILNSRNFGQVRSGPYAVMQAQGDAVISIVADLQDPPEMIPEFIKKWEEGYKVVVGIKSETEEGFFFSIIRKSYYYLVGLLSEIELIKNFTGFGLYDKKVIEIMRQIDDPYPYFRGLICDIGFKRVLIPYKQPLRKRGFTKNNFYTLYDMAMLGITNHSKVPLRLATMLGFVLAIINLIAAVGYFIYKLIFWDWFSVGMAPVVIGFFFFASIQLFFLGILGEYIGAIHTQVLKRPLVIEKERINF